MSNGGGLVGVVDAGVEESTQPRWSPASDHPPATHDVTERAGSTGEAPSFAKSE
jgi:hypothetical protein